MTHSSYPQIQAITGPYRNFGWRTTERTQLHTQQLHPGARQVLENESL